LVSKNIIKKGLHGSLLGKGSVSVLFRNCSIALFVLALSLMLVAMITVFHAWGWVTEAKGQDCEKIKYTLPEHPAGYRAENDGTDAANKRPAQLCKVRYYGHFFAVYGFIGIDRVIVTVTESFDRHPAI